MPARICAQRWNRASADYQERRQLPTDSVQYGPWAPGEKQLALLGSVQGLHILEIGCGGGQNAVALAKLGAVVTGVDISDEQIEFAREVARRQQVEVAFHREAAESLDRFAMDAWDLILGVHVVSYIQRLPQSLSACFGLLRPGGRLVFSLDHPIRDCFFDMEEADLTDYPLRSYFDNRPLAWRFADLGFRMNASHYTIGQWVDMLRVAGFNICQIVEPLPTQEVLDAYWPQDGPLAPLRNIPQTVIFVAQKPEN